MSFLFRSALLLGLAAGFALTTPSAHAQTRWTGNTSGNYGTTTNWIGGTVPNSTSSTIQLGPNTVTNLALNLTTTYTAGCITFNSSQGYSFTNGVMSLNVASGNSIITMGNTGSLNLSSTALTLNDLLNIQTTSTSTLTIGGTITSNNNSVYFNGSGTGTVNLASAFGGSGAVTQASAGTLTLGGANTMTGNVTLSSGTLNINNGGNATASSLGTGNLVISGGTINNTSGGTVTVGTNNKIFLNGSTTFTGSNALDLGTGLVTLGATNTLTIAGTLTVGGTITDGASTFGITKAGTGTLVLNGTSSNYTGVTTLSAGTLAVNTLANGGSVSSIGDSTGAATNLVFNGGTLQYQGATDQSTNRLFTVQSAGATIEAAGTGNITFGNTGAIVFNGTGAARTLTFGGTSTGNNIFSLQITNNGANAVTVNKAGAGMWSLNGTSTYTGNTNVQAGTLNINNGGNSTASAIGTGTLNISSGATLNNTSGANLTLATNNAQYWGGNWTYGGTGNMNMGTGGVTLGGNVVLTTGGSTLTVAGIITDGGSTFGITKNGTGTLVLSGANTYNGSTVLNAGTLDISNARAIGVGGTFVVNGGNIDNSSGSAITLTTTTNAITLNGNFGFIGSNALSMNTNGITLGANVAMNVGASTLTLAGIMTDGASTFGITKDGNGTLVLSGANTYNGSTTLNAGTLDISNARALGVGGTFTITGGNIDNSSGSAITLTTTTNPIAFNGSFGFTGANALSMNTNGVTLNNNVTITTGGSTLTLAGIITDGASTFGITKNGTGTLVLSGANTYNGSTVLNAGTLDLSNARALGVGGNFIINGGNIDNNSGGAITLTTTTNPITLNGNFGFTGANSLSMNTNAVTLGANVVFTGGGTSTLTLAGVISGNGFGIARNGTGTLSLGGANTFTGNMDVQAGTLNIANVNALQDSILNFTGGAVTFSVSNITTGGLAGNTALSLGASNTLTTDVADGLVANYTAILSGTGTSGVTKTGNGTEILAGANTYDGITTISAGTLGVLTLANGGTASGIGDTNGAATNLVFNGGTLQYLGTTAQSTNRLFTVQSAAATIDASGTNTITFSNTSAIVFNGTGVARTLTLSGSNTGNNTFALQITDNGTNKTSLTKSGAGQWVLSGTNTFTGNTAITGGTLLLNNSLALQNSILEYDNLGGAISFGNLSAATIGGLSGAQNLALPASFTLTINPGTGVATTYSGILSGATGAVTKTGAGTQTMSGNNTYGGVTTISAGTLSVSTLANGGVASGIGQSSGAATNLVFNGGTLAYEGTGAQSTNRLFTLNTTGGTIEANGDTASDTITFGNTGAIAFNGTNATRTLTLGGTNTGNNIFSLQIGNNGTGNTSLVKTGVGTWVLNGTSTYAGGTSVNQGILVVQGNNSLGGNSAGNTTVDAGATLRLENGVNIPGGNTSAARGALTINGDGLGGIGALVSGTAAGGNNTWFGNVILGSNSTISSGTTSGSVLGIGDPNEGETPLTELRLGANNLTFIGGANTTTFVSSNMTGTGNVIVNTSGTVEYYMFGNTYSGSTTVQNGTLLLWTLPNAVPYPSGITGNSAQLAIQGNLTIGDDTGTAGSARVQFGPTGEVADANYIISMNSSVNIRRDGILDTNGNSEQIASLTMNGATVTTNGTTLASPYGRLIVGPGGNITTEANPLYSLISGNLTMGNSSGGTLTGFNVTHGSNTTTDLLVSARVDGGSLYKYGNGTMTLTNSNIYTGTTEIANGTLNIQNSHALGNNNDDTLAKATTVDAGGQLQMQGNLTMDTYRLVLNGNGTNNNGALQNVSGNNTWTGTVQVGSGGASMNSTTGGNLTVSGNIGVSSGTPTLTVFGGGNTSFSGNVNGALAIVKNDAGTLTLNGTLANTYTGNTTVNGGTLALNKTGGGNPAAISGSNIIVNTGGTLLNQNDNQILGSTNMILAGGTWNTNGKDEGLGTLTLSASSYLQLGNNSGTPMGTSEIHYDVSNYATNWTAGQTLYIYDWNGSLNGNVNTQVYFGTNYAGLGGSGANQQFNQIVFVNPVGLSSGNYIATILSTGEVVPFLPAPEPGTVAAGASLAALAAFYEYRRRKNAAK